MRPFPEKEMMDIAEKIPFIAVLEKDISFGYEGTVFTNVNSAIAKTDSRPALLNFVAGLGGRDISLQDIREIFEDLEKLKDGRQVKTVQFINLGVTDNG